MLVDVADDQVAQLALVVALISGMVLFGAFTARHRARSVPRAFGPLLVALGLAATVTLVLVVALGVFDPKPRFLVPVGGMVVGNSMTAAAVALNRLGDEVRSSAARIEATLALGATSTQAMLPVLRRSLQPGPERREPGKVRGAGPGDVCERGGQEMQINCVDSDTLRAAQGDPENHGDLVVRVAGFSEFFTKLQPVIQEDVIDRVEHEH